jgi:hypothetical protein
MRIPEPIKKPHDELTWENGEARAKKLQKVKVGDKLWIGEGNYPCGHGIQEVARLTPTLIKIGDGRNNWDQFRRVDGYQVGRGSSYISAFATKEEVKAFEESERLRKEAEETRRTRQQAIEDTAKELDALFAEEDATYVRIEHQHPEGERYSLSVTGLTPERIRKLAPALKLALRRLPA